MIIQIIIPIPIFRASTKALPLASACLPPDRSMFLAAQVDIIIIAAQVDTIIILVCFRLIKLYHPEADLQPDEVRQLPSVPQVACLQGVHKVCYVTVWRGVVYVKVFTL